MTKEGFKPDPFYRPLGQWTHWSDSNGTSLTCVYNNLDGYGFVEGHIEPSGEDFPPHTIHQNDLPNGLVFNVTS